MDNVFNGNKLKMFFKKNKITTTMLANELNLSLTNITMLFNGVEYKNTLKLICEKYNLNISDFYKDFEPPEYMQELHSKFDLLNINHISIDELSEKSKITISTIRYIKNCETYICHRNTATKLINTIDKLLNNFNMENINNDINLNALNLNKNIYSKLINDANVNFDGDINEILKFIINKYYINKYESYE
jgi:DNA helicase IV